MDLRRPEPGEWTAPERPSLLAFVEADDGRRCLDRFEFPIATHCSRLHLPAMRNVANGISLRLNCSSTFAIYERSAMRNAL
jgi:hypothetical protein